MYKITEMMYHIFILHAPRLVQDGWRDFVHPEGPRVYYHPEKVSTHSEVDNLKCSCTIQKIFTDADMRRGKIDSQTLLTKVDALKARAIDIAGVSARMNEETETVLEVDVGSGNTIESCGYYFVDHTTRMIFWAHMYDCQPDGEVLLNVKAAKRPSHISR